MFAGVLKCCLKFAVPSIPETFSQRSLCSQMPMFQVKGLF